MWKLLSWSLRLHSLLFFCFDFLRTFLRLLLLSHVASLWFIVVCSLFITKEVSLRCITLKKPGSKSKQWKMEKIELLESTYCCLLMWVYRFDVFQQKRCFPYWNYIKVKVNRLRKMVWRSNRFFFLRAKTHFNIVRIASNLIVFRFYFIYHIFALLNSSVCSLVISLMTPFWTLSCDDVNVANVTNKMKQWHTLRRVM